MRILAIDTSCDETSVAVSENNKILSNVIASQADLHKEWGGVIPSIARRQHEKVIDSVIIRATKLAGINLKQIDVFAVTNGPGLAIALEVGINKIKQLASDYQKPVVAVNHMVGHIYANFALNRNGNPVAFPLEISQQTFPLIALLISGGHTELILMKDHLQFEKIGQTLDDSAGEAFDKIANMLDWGYPGGPIIEKFAQEGDEDRFNFPIPMRHSHDLNFSFSGLKTAVLREIKEIGKSQDSKFEKMKKGDLQSNLVQKNDNRITLSKKETYKLSKRDAHDIAASFQKATLEHLSQKSLRAVSEYQVKYVVLGGGVTNNIYIRSNIRKNLRLKGVKLYYPKTKKLTTDNAGMIAVAAYYYAQKESFVDLDILDRVPRLSL